MPNTMITPITSWVPIARIKAALQIEPALFLLALVVSTWLLYKLFLGELSPERHRNLRGLFKNLLIHFLAATALLLNYWGLEQILSPTQALYRIVPNLGLIALIWGSVVFVKACRILAFEYLFVMNMRTGVPLLLVNLFSLLLSIILATWILSGIFNFQVAPLLATSAIFSIVLGLALQDTLGNLIAGVALQLDKPYGIGDWVEVQNGAQKWVGQVREITWRAANLVGFTDETITIPNRVMAQAQVANFSGKDRPFLRSQIYRIPYGQPIDRVKNILLAAIENVPGVRKLPEPLALFMESNESWMLFKLVYSIHDFGAQFIIGDAVNSRVAEAFARERIPFAVPRLHLSEESA